MTAVRSEEIQREGRGFWQRVDARWLLTPKAIYFAIGFLYYSFYVFRMDFYKEHFGFLEDRGSMIQTVSNVTSFLGVTVLCNIADALGNHKRMLIILCLCMAASFELTALKWFISEEYRLSLALVAFGLFGAFSSGVMPLADYQILKLLKSKFRVDQSLYGQQVLFGTAAHGFMSLGQGYLIELCGVNMFFWLIPAVSVFCATTIAILGHPDQRVEQSEKDYEAGLGVRSSGRGQHGEEEGQGGEAASQDDRQSKALSYVYAICRPRFLLFLLAILSIGIGRQLLNFYLPNYLVHSLGLRKKQIGLASFGSSMFSLLFLVSGPRLIPALGIRPMLLIGSFSLAMRLAAYAFFTPGLEVVQLIELLNGLSFSFTHLSGVKEAADCAPKGWEAVFQATYTCAYVQLPSLLVSLIGGFLYPIYGGQWLIQQAFFLSLLSLLLLTTIVVVTRRRDAAWTAHTRSGSGSGPGPGPECVPLPRQSQFNKQ